MRAFLSGFLSVAALCTALWFYLNKGRTPQPTASAGHRPERAALRRPVADISVTPASVRASWAGFSSKKPPGIQQWAALDALTPTDLAALAKAMQPGHNGVLWKAAMMRWASVDGPAAMAHARTYEEKYEEGFSSILGEMLTCWIASDPAGSAGEIGRLYLDDDYSDAFATLARTNFTAALDIVARHLGRGGKENSEWTDKAHPGFLAEKLSEPGRMEEFRRWLKNQQDPLVAARIFSVMYQNMQHEDAWLRPEKLPEWMPGRELIPQTLEYPDTVWAMGALAAGENPLTSLRDKEKVPYQERTDAPRHHSLQTRLRDWAARDPESAGLWLKAQPPSTELDGAVRGYLGAVSSERPDAAVLWADTIKDPGERFRECAVYYNKWHAREPAAAEAWLAGAMFTDFQRAYIGGNPRRH